MKWAKYNIAMTNENALLSVIIHIFRQTTYLDTFFWNICCNSGQSHYLFFQWGQKKRWTSITLAEILILSIQYTVNIFKCCYKELFKKRLLIFTKPKSKLIFKIILNYHFKQWSFYAYKWNFVSIHHKRACDFLSLNNITNKILKL